MTRRAWVLLFLLTLVNVGITLYNLSLGSRPETPATSARAAPTNPLYGPNASTSPETVPSLDLMVGLLQLQQGKDHRLTAEQASAIQPVLTQVAIDTSKADYMRQQLSVVMQQQLRPEQKQAVERMAAATGTSTMTTGGSPAAVPPPSPVPAPGGDTRGVLSAPDAGPDAASAAPVPLEMLAEYVRERAGISASARVPIPATDLNVPPQTINVDIYAQAIVSFRGDPRLALTADQAKALAPYVLGYFDFSDQVRQNVGRAVDLLTSPQRAFLVRHHRQQVAGGGPSVTPTELLPSLWSSLE